MMPKRFVATENAVEKGLDKITPAEGAKLVIDWAKEVAHVDMPAAKALHDDLMSLEKELHKDKPDGAAIKKLLSKLGAATTKLSTKCEDAAVAEKLIALGKALSHSGG